MRWPKGDGKGTNPLFPAFNLQTWVMTSAVSFTRVSRYFGAVRAVLPDVSRQAVYDVLAALTTAGLVRKIQPSGSVARYESRVGDNHHHIVCRSCGVIADVDCAVGDAPCLTPSDDGTLDGFVLDEAEVIYWGLCPDCSISHVSRSQP